MMPTLKIRRENMTATKIQMWHKKIKKSGYCEDCNAKNKLYYAPACVDFQIMNKVCCGKYICYSGCKYKCKNDHLNIFYDDDGYFYTQNCTICSDEIIPCCTWNGGLSPKEYRTK